MSDPVPVPAAVRKGDGRVPPRKEDRERLRALAAEHVKERGLVPPLSMEELHTHARLILVRHALPVVWNDYLAVLVSNEVWRETVGRVPFDRRVILLPQCLRDKATCPASTDAIGILCEQCGRCDIGRLQEMAEAMGYVVLVAEGTTVVMRLIESGKVDAVIGVSCLPVLEQAFPHLAKEAIPGLAIPLLQDGCNRTAVDVEWIEQAIRLRSDETWLTRADLDRLREEVRGWFTPLELDRRMGMPASAVERLEREWLLRGGKRWRPFMLAAVWRALRAPERDIPESVRHLACAVECFHKASLVHDDIEDEDAERYGTATLHREHGVPIALNVGDALLGEGYRLITRSGAVPTALAAMLEVAAEGHRMLCLGQGEELAWLRHPAPMSVERHVDIFRHKTAPAFEVSLRLGALAAEGPHPGVENVLREFSSALGVAYQIRDDLDDLHTPPDRVAQRPRLSILSALAHEAAAESQRPALERAWLSPDAGSRSFDLPGFIVRSGGEDKALQLMEHHKNAAIRSLEPLQNVHLKTLLRRMVGRLVPRR